MHAGILKMSTYLFEVIGPNLSKYDRKFIAFLHCKQSAGHVNKLYDSQILAPKLNFFQASHTFLLQHLVSKFFHNQPSKTYILR